MDILDKFFKKFSYKFPKGYPDINDEQDMLMLEGMLKEMGINILLENQDLISIIKSNITGYGDLEVKGRDKLVLTFSEIPSTGATSTSMRKDVYADIKSLVNKEKSLSDFRKLSTGSSLGSALVNFQGKDYKLVVKGASKDDETDTNIKEGLVSLFYTTNINSPFTSENYENRITQLIELANNGISGESNKATQKVISYLEAISGDNKAANINFINQPLSSAIAIKEVYPGQKLIRTGLFDSIRKKAALLTGLPADKWCPGDVYVQLDSISLKEDDNIEIINDLFNDKWGGDSKPLTAVSLKQEEAQGGKAKALLNKYTKVKDDYNLTKKEQNYTSEEYREGIKNLRPKIQSLIAGNNNIIYNLVGEEIEDDKLKGKYAALKSIEFLFRQFSSDEVDDAVVALVGFALSLTGVNPTFFKVTGQKSGAPGKVDKFSRGQNVVLFNVDGDYDPIQIEDSPTFGGLKLNFKIEKGGEPYSVSINARNNGKTQGTLEVQKIQPIS